MDSWKENKGNKRQPPFSHCLFWILSLFMWSCNLQTMAQKGVTRLFTEESLERPTDSVLTSASNGQSSPPVPQGRVKRPRALAKEPLQARRSNQSTSGSSGLSQANESIADEGIADLGIPEGGIPEEDIPKGAFLKRMFQKWVIIGRRNRVIIGRRVRTTSHDAGPGKLRVSEIHSNRVTLLWSRKENGMPL